MVIYVIIAFLLLLALICKKDKKMFLVLMLFMYFVMAFNTDNIDMDNYKVGYDAISSFSDVFKIKSIEPGLLFIFSICKLFLGFSYQQMVGLIAAVSLLLIGYCIYKNSDYPALVAALYFIAPFFPLDIIQIRNLIVEVIVVNALVGFFKSGYNKVLFFVCAVLFASLFHVSALFYLSFVLLKYLSNPRTLYKISLGCSALLILSPMILFKIPFVATYKLQGYLDNDMGVNGRILLLALFVIIDGILIGYMKNSIVRNNIDKNKLYLVNSIYLMHILLLIPLTMTIFYNYTFSRLVRNILILDYIMFSYYISKVKKSKYRILLVFYIVMGFVWSTINVMSQWNVILQNHIIFEKLW